VGSAVLPWTTAGHEPDVGTGVLLEKTQIATLVTIREPRIARARRPVEKPGVMLAGHVVDRVIEVEVVVVHPVHGIAHIVRVNGQAQATLNEFSGCHPSISGSSLK
jgi:hypothetical protein